MKSRIPPMPIRLSRQHERWIYLIGAILFLSGLGWLIAHNFLAAPGEFGDAHHPSEPWWLRLHGAAAMGFLMVIGSLLPGHIASAWRLRKNHRSGLFMLALVAVLLLTGYGLYYAGDEQSRPWISLIHWIAGTAAAAGLWLHIWLGKRKANMLHAVVRKPIAPDATGTAAAVAVQRKRSS
ncbi:hypothetical protein [Collimonas silvisoli]|uniref:hypothetical protein n=1 Tax=Collimonas silvisoli TaxID=2825884 RepID=UPI001B8D14B8|nr:hypothetical protein [Collimonas silvisoli]